MKLFKHFLIMALALTACAGFTSCKDDDDDEDSKRPLTGYWVSEGEHEDFFYYIHPNGCGFCGYLIDTPPRISDVFESYVITKDDELIFYWLDYDLTTDPDNKGKISIGKDSFTTKYNNFVKKGKDYPYALNFHPRDSQIADWWNEHTK